MSNMKLNDIWDMEEYLENRCYCPGEIYDSTGIFCRIYDGTEECEILAEGKYKELYIKAVLCGNQIIAISSEDSMTILDCERFDSTEHNIAEIKRVLVLGKGEITPNFFNDPKLPETVDAVMA